MTFEIVRRIVRCCGVALVVTLTACASAQDHVHHFAHPSPTLSDFTVCQGYGCRIQKHIRLEPFVWDEVAKIFHPEPTSAGEERRRLGQAVAFLEMKIGAAIGASTDRAAAETFNTGPDQLDCIDETVNTTTYLRLLSQHGLMRWHVIGTPNQRGWLLANLFGSTDFITNTAVIMEIESKTEFAIDSYFYPNGRPPKIMPLTEWRKNWRPLPNDPLLQPL
ncbi:hypothetical protein [Candidatus Nitronereus thalassa]|uniref:Uncharacterized protein n=1 Tax=Candidatus Nitronereus thalassa TaxID=3020898 RepID=A0ABU3K5H5_9BACT|nr:hypothetical protein [Candidatus Nitronereus thalassa]MDT7041615.1 hypothetical protein [Candidatus Nitronereus thalassa]